MERNTAAKYPVLELAVLAEFFHPGPHFRIRQIAAATGPAELQHGGRRNLVRVLRLRPVVDALWKISHDARRHFAITVESERAFEAGGDLFEVVGMTR